MEHLPSNTHNIWLVAWEEQIPVNNPLYRPHVRVVEANSSLEAWEDIIHRENIQTNKVRFVAARKWDLFLDKEVKE